MTKRENGNPFREKCAPTAAKQERAYQNEQADCIPVHQEQQPQDCKHFQKCSAPICPLDKDWHRRSYFDGEPVCYLLSEWPKEATRPFLIRAIGGEMAQTLAEVYPKVIEVYGPLKKRLERASRTPSRLKFPGVDHD